MAAVVASIAAFWAGAVPDWSGSGVLAHNAGHEGDLAESRRWSQREETALAILALEQLGGIRFRRKGGSDSRNGDDELAGKAPPAIDDRSSETANWAYTLEEERAHEAHDDHEQDHDDSDDLDRHDEVQDLSDNVRNPCSQIGRRPGGRRSSCTSCKSKTARPGGCLRQQHQHQLQHPQTLHHHHHHKHSRSGALRPLIATTRSAMNAKRVGFDLDGITTHDITPYSEVYGLHPREFQFGRGWCGPVACIGDPCCDSESDGEEDEEGEIDLEEEFRNIRLKGRRVPKRWPTRLVAKLQDVRRIPKHVFVAGGVMLSLMVIFGDSLMEEVIIPKWDDMF